MRAVLFLLLAGCAARQPVFVDAVDSAAVATSSPATDPAAWLLAHIDIETTGLVPGYHEPIDIGIVLTTLDGDVGDSLFLRIQPRHPERTSPGAARVNGFDARIWQQANALSPAQAVDSLFAFHQRARAGRNLMMVAFNSQFDTAFLDHLMRQSGRSWRELYHYFVLDIPSMAWARGYRQLTNKALAEQLGVADEPRTASEHTGITGAMLNVRIYRALQKKVQQ
jgi:DNA polymerase III epsilon subunit-like protein